MGFDNECVINIQLLPQKFFCPFCRSLVYPGEAVQAPCKHLFCRPCLAYVASHTHVCPCDGHVVTVENSKLLMESNKELAANIGKIFVHCLYHRSGCTWQGPLSECLNHCSGCTIGNSLVFCNLCGSQVLHRLLKEHRQNCPLQPSAMSSQGLGYQNMTSGYAENQQSQEMFRHRQQGQQHYGHLPPQFRMNQQPPVQFQPPTCFLGPRVMQHWSFQCAPSFVCPPDPLQPRFPTSLQALHHGQPQLQMLPLYPFTPPPTLPQPQLSYQVQSKEQQHFPRHPAPPPSLAPPLVPPHCASRPHLQRQPPLQVPHPFHPTVPQRAPHHNFLHPSIVIPPSYEHHSQGVAYDYNRPPSHWRMPLPSVNPQSVPPVQLPPQPIPKMPLHMQPLGLAPPTGLALPVGSNASELMSKYETKTQCPVYSFEGKSDASESQSVALSKTSTQFGSEDGPPGFVKRPRYSRSESHVPREVTRSLPDGLGQRKANHDTVEGFQSGPQVQGHQNVAADIARDVKLENSKRRKIG